MAATSPDPIVDASPGAVVVAALDPPGELRISRRGLELLRAALEAQRRIAAASVEERRRVEAELRASEARLGSIVETMAEGIVITDASGVILFANPAAERMLKRPRRAMIGRDLRGARIRPHRMDGRPLRQEELLQGRLRDAPGGIVGEELRFLRPDRSFLDATVNAAAVRDPAGEVSSIVLTISDSTARRRAEALRRESEERLRAIVAAALDGIIAADDEDRIVEFNPAAEALFGRSRAEVLGQAIRILLPPRLRAAQAAEFERVRTRRARGRMTRLTTVGMKGDGSEFPLELSVGIFSEKGRPMLVASARDLAP